jgi:nucleoside-diphosphate-sugar epimerase
VNGLIRGEGAKPDGFHNWIIADATDQQALIQAACGTEVIVHALNPVYPKWQKQLPRLTRSVLAAAKASGARVLIPGNVYNFGANMPVELTEQTAQTPTTRKGRLRVEMEREFARSHVPVLVVRSGDFFERETSGSWFDSHITPNLSKGQIMYPGPLDKVHAWAYLPDLARACVALLEHADRLERFEEVGFAGYSLTGAELVSALQRVSGRSLQVKSMPWPIIRVLGLVSPMLREVVEVQYLWQTPHRIDDQKLQTLIPEFRPTPLDEALAEAISEAV